MANVSILAIIGHATRSKEVVEILKMMGGKYFNDVKCNYPDRLYFVLYERIYWQDFDLNKIDKFQIFTLEQFLERYPFKIGDRVLISEYESEGRICEMRWDPTCKDVKYLVYRCDDKEWYTAEELLDYNEPHKEETSKIILEKKKKELI